MEGSVVILGATEPDRYETASCELLRMSAMSE